MSSSLYKVSSPLREPQWLGFSSCGRQYACDLLWVKEVLRCPSVTPVNLAANYVRGVVHLRGQILTALDLEARLGHECTDSRPTGRCIVFKTTNDLVRLPHPPADFELADSDPIGLLVDAIGDILPPGTIVLPAPPETLSGLDTRFIAGVISSADHLTTVLQIGNFVSMSEPRKSHAV
ncbi:MAG: chemotaxis protein CheW [bacterium]